LGSFVRFEYFDYIQKQEINKNSLSMQSK
jgi:hypothetical protein